MRKILKFKRGDEIINDNNSEISSVEKINKILNNITDEIFDKNEDNIFEPSTTILHGKNYNIHVISNIKDYTVILFAKEQVLQTLDDKTNYVLYSCSFNAKNHKEAEKIAMKKIEEYLKEQKQNSN